LVWSIPPPPRKKKSTSQVCLVPWPIPAAQIGDNMRGCVACVRRFANVVRFLVFAYSVVIKTWVFTSSNKLLC
jgi:hypothetical protein